MGAKSRMIKIGQSEFGCPCHACAFFNSRDEEYELLLPFSKSGAEAGERLFQVVDKAHLEERRLRLAEAGIDVPAAESNGQLEIRPWENAYLRGNRFDQNAMLELIQEVLEAGRSSGFPLTRLWANMEWALDDLPGVHDIVEYETRLNHFLPNYDDVVVCTYDLSKFSAPVVMDIMRTHPQVIVGGVLQDKSILRPPRRISCRVEPPTALIQWLRPGRYLRSPIRPNGEASLRRCVRDLVALSSLPALWIKADASQIADSIGQLAVSILDAEFACVFLRDPAFEGRASPRESQRALDRPGTRSGPVSRRIRCSRSTTAIKIACGQRVCPSGGSPSSGIIALSGRADFPTDTEQTLLRVAANQAAIAIERSKSEAKSAEQTRALQRLTRTETALYTFTDRLFRAESQHEIYEAAWMQLSGFYALRPRVDPPFDAAAHGCDLVAWRALSDEYRKAVDGHSPWKPEDTEAESHMHR